MLQIQIPDVHDLDARLDEAIENECRRCLASGRVFDDETLTEILIAISIVGHREERRS